MELMQLVHLAAFALIIMVIAYRLPKLAMSRPTAWLMLVALVTLTGLTAWRQLPLELMPNVSYGHVSIYIDVRGGMPPPEVERLVTKPVEAAMGTVSKLKRIISTSKKHRAIISLEFEPGTNMDLATLEVREKFLSVKSQLPKMIEKPVIAHYEEADAPVVIAALTSQNQSPEMLRQLVERSLKEHLLRLEGVANIEIGGGRTRKILVELDKHHMVAQGLSTQQIVSVLEQNNLTVRVGSLAQDHIQMGVRALGAFRSLDEIRHLGLAVTEQGGMIRLRDIGTVKDDYLAAESHSRLNAKTAVTLYIQKESSANTVAVVKKVETLLRQFKQDLPTDVTLAVISNQGQQIKSALQAVAMTLVFGICLVVLVISWFLAIQPVTRLLCIGLLSLLLLSIMASNIWQFSFAVNVSLVLIILMLTGLLAWWRKDMRPAFIVAGSMPVTLLITLSWIYIEQYSLNVMTLAGLVLGIGMLVENAIVVLENYDYRLRQSPHLPAQHIMAKSAQEMIAPMMGGTLTTIVVFLPFAMLQKQAQLLFAGIAFTVTATLLASLLTSLTWVPALGAMLPPPEKRVTDTTVSHMTVWIKRLAQRWRAIKRSLKLRLRKHRLLLIMLGVVVVTVSLFVTTHLTPWVTAYAVLVLAGLTAGVAMVVYYGNGLKWIITHRWVTFLLVAVLTLLSGLIFITALPKDFMAASEQSEFVVYIECSSGLRLDISNQVVQEVEEKIKNTVAIKSALKHLSSRVEGWSSKVYVTLKPRHQRTLSTQDVIDRLRPELNSIGEAYDTFIYFSEPRQGKELVLDVYGYHYETLARLAMQLANGLAQIPGLSDIKVRYRPGRPEASIKLQASRVAQFGLTNRGVAEAVHAQIQGLRATSFYHDDNDIETVVRLKPNQVATMAQLKKLQLATPKLGHIPLEHISDFEFGLSPSEIWHQDKTRMIQVSANLGNRPLGQAAQAAQKIIAKTTFPEDYYADLGGDYEAMVAANRSFWIALLLTLLLIFMVLAALFESWQQPVIMMISVVLASIGAVAALAVTGCTVSLGVSIGLLMLGGIVVNNGIMLVDRINHCRAAWPHISLTKIVIWAGKQRRRPILITATTTLFGLLPMALDQSDSAVLWRPLAITVIGGLISGTVMTLLIVPSVYLFFDSSRVWIREKSYHRYQQLLMLFSPQK